MKYVPLNIKTNNSLLKSMIKLDELISKAKELGFDALTITDDNMYGCMDFYHLCLKNNIKPIIGLTLYIDNEFAVYAKNDLGYRNLLKLTTLSSSNDLDCNQLKKYSNDLICIVPNSSLNIYDNLKEIFLDEIFIGYSSIEDRNKLTGDNLVFFNEVLYLNKEDEKYIKYLYAIKDGVLLDNAEFSKKNNYLINYEEYTSKYGADLDNNKYIYESCNLKITTNENLIPIYNCPNNMDSFTYLKSLCKEGMFNKIGIVVPKVYIERLKYELDVINKMGFCNYFLIVWDYVKFAKDNGILVGPGRGSAAASLVSYLLNITTIDPIKYDLLFERFLNPERITMPDIDIDFEDVKREEIIKYCIRKYGDKNVAPIITFGTMAAKQALRDVGRVMDVDLVKVDSVCKHINSSLSLRENYQSNEKLRQIVNIDEENKKLFFVASKFEGIKRHTSIHAAGVVMCNRNLDEIIPLEKDGDIFITGISMTYLEELGLLKMDFLALRNLTLINDCLKDIGNISFDDIPTGDSLAMKVFYDASTIGIFQFESSGMMNFIRKLKPSNFDDLVAALALFRPGPMQNIDSYINRKNGKEKIDYLHDNLANILKPTYGIIIYQEQIMKISNILAGYSYGEADVLRRAMSKKNEDILLSLKDDFINRSIARGYSRELSSKVYALILKFASYGFNKAHSVSYAFIAYKMAYLKAHYPLYFMKQLLNNSIGSDTKTKDYIYECKKNNIEIMCPNIFDSSDKYIIKDNKLLCPLTIIKGMGLNATTKIIEESQKQKFKDIFDFILRIYGRVVNRKIIENMIDGGVLDTFGYNRRTLKENLDIIINYSEIGDLLDDENLKPELTFYDEYDKKELMNLEFKVYGLYLSKHPVTDFKLKHQNIVDLNNIPLYFDKSINICIYVDYIREISTKNGKKMIFIDGSDEVSTIDVVLFSKLYEKNKDIKKGDILFITGLVEKRHDKYQVVASKIEREEK